MYNFRAQENYKTNFFGYTYMALMGLIDVLSIPSILKVHYQYFL